MNDKFVYIMVTEVNPNNIQQIYEVYSTETTAWQAIERSYYKHLNYLLKTDHKIDAIKFDYRTVLIVYHNKKGCYQTKYKILKRHLCQ